MKALLLVLLTLSDLAARLPWFALGVAARRHGSQVLRIVAEGTWWGAA